MARRKEVAPCKHRGGILETKTVKRGCCGGGKRVEYKNACALLESAWDADCRKCKQIEPPTE